MEAIETTIAVSIKPFSFNPCPISDRLQTLINKYDAGIVFGVAQAGYGAVMKENGIAIELGDEWGMPFVFNSQKLPEVKFRRGEIGVVDTEIYVAEGTEAFIAGNVYQYKGRTWGPVGNRVRRLSPVRVCLLPEGAPIGLVRLDSSHIGYGCSVPIAAIGAFFEKFYSINLGTGDTKEIEREQFHTLTDADKKVVLDWRESFGFTYVLDGDKLKKMEYSNSKIMYRVVPEESREIASYSKEVEAVALSPDGTTVLISVDGDVHCVRPSGDSAVALSSEGVHYGQPVFGRRSDRFYVRSVHADNGDRAILECDLKSGQTVTVVRTKNLLGFCVSPDGGFLAYLEGSAPTKRIRILAMPERNVIAEIDHEESSVVGNPLLVFSDDSSAIYFGRHDVESGALFRADVR